MNKNKKFDRKIEKYKKQFKGYQTSGRGKTRPDSDSEPNPPSEMRLNRYLSDAGICSRRQADRYLEEGRITVDGVPAVLGQKIRPGQDISLDDQPVHVQTRKVVLAFNKPRGIVCTTEKREKDNIIDYLDYPIRVYPVGRLDKDSEGLILLTNDGDLMNEVLKARNYHEKEYLVEVNRPVTNPFMKAMSEGVEILDTKTRPCKVIKTGLKSFKIILTQGLNRQIRRMCEALDYRVVSLKRVRVMNIELGDLPTGEYREITGEERYELYYRAGLKPPGRVPYEAPKKDQEILPC